MLLGQGLTIKPSVWNPAHSAGLEFWFAKGIGITESSNAISKWTNSVNTSQSFDQATASSKPTLVAASDYAIDFDGNDNLTGTQLTFTDTFVIGIKFTVEDANAANDVLIGDNTSTSNFLRLNDANTIGIKTSSTQGSADVATSTQFNSGVTTHLVATRDGSNVVRYWIDGTLQTNTVTKSGDFLVDSIGVRAEDTNQFSGKIWEVIAYKDVYSVELAELLSGHLQTI